MRYRVAHVGTSLETRGGISAVLKVVFDDKQEELSHIVTHCDGSVAGRVFTFARGWVALIASLLRRKTTIYHIHSASYGSWARKSLCVLTIKLFARPVVLHMHGAEFAKFYENKLGASGRASVRSILNRVDAIIALSPEWAEFYRKLAPQTRVMVIPNAVAIPPALNETHWQSADHWRIACLGRLGQRKGTFDLLRAFAGLDRNPELCLPGDGEIDRARSLAQELGVDSRVDFPGWIGPEKRAEILASTHVFALPSYAEGLPMALLEAMSYGLPVVSTPVGGIPTLIEDGANGILVAPGDIDALAQSLKQLMDNPKQAVALGAAARKTIIERYDASAFRAALHKLHAEIAAKYFGAA